jgi:hypothetical protein
MGDGRSRAHSQARQIGASRRPRSVSLCLGLIVLSALTWLSLGVLITFRLHPAILQSQAVRAGVASGAIAAAGTLAGLAILLTKRIAHAYYLSLAVLGMSALAVVFDDFGWADLIAVIINVAAMLLLIKDRSWYLGSRPQPG